MLQGLQGGEGVSYQIVGVLRLLRVRDRDAELWGRIGRGWGYVKCLVTLF